MKRLVLLLSIVATACGGKSTTSPAGGDTTTPTAGPTGPLASGQWASMDPKAKGEFMGKVVMPRMAELFKGFDAEEFGEMDCKTCHGKGAEDHTFKMPSPDLPGLSVDMIMNPDADHKAVTEFMAQSVKPEMAALLGLPEYSQDNPQGFGCFHCHPQVP